MKLSALKYWILSTVASLSAVVIFFVSFYGFLTVYGASLVGHYTAIRLWDEALIGICLLGVLTLVLIDHKIRSHTLSRRLVWLILSYSFVVLVWGAVSLSEHYVSKKALGYGLIVDLRFPVFFLVTWAVAIRTNKLKKNWEFLIIIPSAIIGLFGLAEVFILPHDFLRHFGYGPNTIPVFETINHNQHFYRIKSLLRGANPLGDYLVIPIALLVNKIMDKKASIGHYALGLILLANLFFSFSRGAWIGCAVSIIFLVLVKIKTKKAAAIAGSLAALLVVVLLVIFLVFQNNVSFENYVFHTQKNSTSQTTSDAAHNSALKTGIKQVIHNPVGNGPGTAGPASIYNNNRAKISESYYLQVAEETGIIGLILFILINIGVGYILWTKRQDPLALFLLASLIGLTILNVIFTYAWDDDTTALVWWGLAGIAMTPIENKTDKKKNNPKPIIK